MVLCCGYPDDGAGGLREQKTRGGRFYTQAGASCSSFFSSKVGRQPNNFARGDQSDGGHVNKRVERGAAATCRRPVHSRAGGFFGNRGTGQPSIARGDAGRTGRKDIF